VSSLGDVLTVEDVRVRFGGLKALDGISFSVNEGEVLGMIGPNGSGKSTAFNVITGSVRPQSGTVTFLDEDITARSPQRVARMGITRTFQVVRPFAALTALENVLIGRMYGRVDAGRSDAVDASLAILERVGLKDKSQVIAGDLTILERKWLEVARALAGDPMVVLLDEFMAGISSNEVPAAVDLVKSVNASGVTVVLVEHIVKAIVGACDRVIVLDAGKLLAEGTVDEIIEDPKVIQAYLGSRRAQG
jgi:branched-chain amino acid transport system ATP-binding protein